MYLHCYLHKAVLDWRSRRRPRPSWPSAEQHVAVGTVLPPQRSFQPRRICIFSWSRLKWNPAESGVWPKSTGCRTEDQAKRVALGLKNDGQKENSCTRTGLDIAEDTRKVIQLLFLLLFLLNSLNIFTCYSDYSPSPRLTLFFSFIILIFV